MVSSRGSGARGFSSSNIFSPVSLFVVTEHDALAGRYRLAGEHVTIRHFLVSQTIILGHGHLALEDLGPAGCAYPALAGVGCGHARRLHAIQDAALRWIEGDA